MEILLTVDLKREYMIRLADQFECYCEGLIGKEELLIVTHNILVEMTEKFDNRAYNYLIGLLNQINSQTEGDDDE